MSTKLNFHPLLKLCKKEWKLSCTKDKITAWYQQNNEHVQAFYIKYSHKCLQVNVRFYLLFRIQKIWLVIIPKYFLAIFFTLITTNKQINSMEQSPSCKANSSSISQGIPAFYGTNRLITTFTTACLLSLSWARSIQSMTPHPTSWRSIFMLSSHLCLGLPSGLFLSDFPTKPCMHLSSPICATCPHPSHSSWFDHPNNIWLAIEIMKFLIM